MFKVVYCGGNIPLELGLFETKLSAEVFIIEDHENEMILNNEMGEMEEMNLKEKWDFYETELKKYSIVPLCVMG